jgi:K+-sensing histidine kinase KdpD
MLASMIIFHHFRIVREIAHFAAQERTTLVIVGKVRRSGTKIISEQPFDMEDKMESLAKYVENLC